MCIFFSPSFDEKKGFFLTRLGCSSSSSSVVVFSGIVVYVVVVVRLSRIIRVCIIITERVLESTYIQRERKSEEREKQL